MMAHHHRPTLKQQNKPFKGRKSKDQKGRVPRPAPKSPALSTAAQARLNRRNTQKQAQATKRASLVASTRIFSGVDGAPRIVALIPLCQDVHAADALRALASSVAEDLDGIGEGAPLWRMKVHRFKTSIQFIPVRYGRHWEALDAAKAADYVLFLLSPTVEVPEVGDTLLRSLQAQGLPTVVSAISPDPSLDPKLRTTILKSLLSFMQYFDPSQGRVFDLSLPSDSLSAVRSLAEGRPSEVRWRSGRPWLVGESLEWEDGTLKVTGVVRGARLSANRLVHLLDYGDHEITKIFSAPITRSKLHKGLAMVIEPQILSERVPSSADSMISINVPDDMANEQTWPTEEELAGTAELPEERMEGVHVPDAKHGTTPKRIKRLPKGMSEYQASWIVDESDEEDGSEDEGADYQDDTIADDEEDETVPISEAAEMESERKSIVAFQDLDVEEEERQLREWRDRAQEERDAKEFPDEIDTPRDIPARSRFARYRGLRSLRTSPWDPYENLPQDYAKIFEFEDFKRTERDARRVVESEGVEPGTRVTVHVRDVPREAADSQGRGPIVLYGLLTHEHKKTVVHFTVQRNTEYAGSIKSKDSLILCYGSRRLRVKPIYSQHTRGGGRGVNNVHKLERFLWHGTTAVASVYAPVTFGRLPCSLLRESEDVQAPWLVATGTLLPPDPTRIILKRIVLSGHPFRVQRHSRGGTSSATVRYMFFDPTDVTYFKPIQLHTKLGRTGHVRESLGTHGYFKATFDGPVGQMDTICMALYKRVYPRWSEAWRPGLVLDMEAKDREGKESGIDTSGDVVMQDC